MKRLIVSLLIVSTALMSSSCGRRGYVYERFDVENRWSYLVERAGTVLTEIQMMPEDHIPEGMLQKCYAIAIFPSTISAGFGLGGKYGQGIIMVRDRATGLWSPPAVFVIAGGSIGWQIGGQATDIVLLIMSERSVEGLVKGKVKLGVDAAATAGPVGREAEAATDAKFGGILAYSRSRGLFIGIKLEGAVITQHWDGNKELYRKNVSAEEIMLKKKVRMPRSARNLVNILKNY